MALLNCCAEQMSGLYRIINEAFLVKKLIKDLESARSIDLYMF